MGFDGLDTWAGTEIHSLNRRALFMSDQSKTPPAASKFDPSIYPPDTLFHERRTGQDRRDRAEAVPTLDSDRAMQPPLERRQRKERRKRIDPTTFEKQYTVDEIEFMTAVQRFKTRNGKSFPTHGDVLRVAISLGYRRPVADEPFPEGNS
jgi:hypothetical protein